MVDVFVSYAREDEARISALVRMLEARGLAVFWDRQIPAGKTWREHIGQALAQAPCVLVAWSTHSIGSTFVAEEADDGRQRGVLVPVLIDTVLPPLGFRSLQAADLRGLAASEPPPGFEALLGAIRAVLADTSAASDMAAPLAPDAPVAPVAAGTPAAAHGMHRAALTIGVSVLLLLGSAWAYHLLAGRGAASPAAAVPTAAEVRRPSGAQAQRAYVEVLDRWATPSGGLGLRVQVTPRGVEPLAVSTGSVFALVRASGAVESPVESRPLFETLQRDDPALFELRFSSADGSALRVSLPGEPPQLVELPAPR